MIINSVYLNNFISHKKSKLDLGYGINVVVGPNGSGKTSILDAISFALFNDYSNCGRKENLINARARKGAVEVEFTEGGIKYSIEWSIDRNKASRGSLYRIQNDGKALLAQGGANAVIPEIEKILEMDKSMFLQSIYVRQGEIEELVTSTPANRKELISKLLGLEDLQKAWEGIKIIIDDYGNQSIKLEGEITHRASLEADRKKHLDKSIELEGSLLSKKKELRSLQEQIAALQTLLGKLDLDSKKFYELDKEKEILENGVKADGGMLEKENNELKKAIKAEEIVGTLEKKIEKLPSLEEYAHLLSTKNEQKLKLEGLQQTLDRVDALEGTLSENKKNHELYLEKKKLLAEEQRRRKKLEGAEVRLEEANKQIKTLEKNEWKIAAELNKELAKCATIIGVEVTVDNVKSALENKMKETQEIIDRLDGSINEFGNKIGTLDGRRNELNDNLLKLKPSNTEISKCPTCETHLSSERMVFLIQRFSAEKDEIDKDQDKLDKEAEATKREKKQAEVKLRKLCGLDPARIEETKAELGEVKKDLDEHRQKLPGIIQMTDSLRELGEEIAKLEPQVDELEDSYLNYDSASRELAKLSPRSEIEGKMVPIKVSVDDIDKKVENSVITLGYEPKDTEKELKETRALKQQYDQNLPIAKRKGEHELSILAIDQEIKKKEEKIKGIIEDIRKLDYSERKHILKRNEHDSQTGIENNLREAIAGMDEAKKAADNGIADCEQKSEALKKKEDRKRAIDHFIRVLNDIRTAYGKDGVQKIVRARTRPLLERASRDLFERFNLAYSDIRIDDDYNIMVLGPQGEQSIDQISGGERVALAISFRLAIAQVLSGRVETIIMDEPTTHLDEERRKELVNILSSFFKEGGRIIPQMLIITHHHEIEDVADLVYTIRKEEGYSIAEIVNPL